MPTLTKGQEVPQNPDLEVFTGGTYANKDLVECNKKGEDFPLVAFQAQFIVGGEEIYQD